VSQEVIIQVRNSTPLLVGWYRQDKIDPMGIRATEIKGLWRYWARAVIGGVLYDQGYLAGDERKIHRDNIYRVPNEDEIKAITCLVGKVLGLGYVSREYSEASRFKLFVETRSQIKPSVFPEDYRDLQRVRLLTIRGKIEFINRGAEFNIRVLRRTAPERDKHVSLFRLGEELAIKILIMTLQLSGLGKGGRRGLGSLDIISLRGFSTQRSIRDLMSDIYSLASKIIEDPHTREICKCLTYLKRRSEDHLPPIPIISKRMIRNNINISSISIISQIRFRDIHNFFLRSYRCYVLTKRYDCFDNIRNTYSGWFLGLPRKQQISKGYEAGEISRRASPIYVAYHERENLFGEGAYVSILLSADWPYKITWDGVDITINDDKILDAYKIVWDEFEDYLKRLNAKTTRVWP